MTDQPTTDLLREAADIAEAVAMRLHREHEVERSNGAYEVMTELLALANAAASSPASVPADGQRRARYAAALVRYDWNAGISGRVTPSEHHYGEADAVTAVADAEQAATRSDAFRRAADMAEQTFIHGVVPAASERDEIWDQAVRAVATMLRGQADEAQPTTEAEAAATFARECLDRPAIIRWCADRVRSTDGDYAILAAAEYLDDLALEAEEANDGSRMADEEQPACIHPEGYDRECPCPPSCACCRVTAADDQPATETQDGDQFAGGSYLTTEHDTLGMIAARFSGDLLAWEMANPWVTDTAMPLPAGLRVAIPENDAGEEQPVTETRDDGLRCVCGDPVQLLDESDPTSWIHSPGSDTPCLDARPRCPHCQLPHDLTPSVVLACASIRASIADRAATVARQDGAATREADRIVAYRSLGGRILRCLSHIPPEPDGDFIPVTSDDLPDGGVCTYPDCGVDVLIPQERS